MVVIIDGKLIYQVVQTFNTKPLFKPLHKNELRISFNKDALNIKIVTPEVLVMNVSLLNLISLL